MKKLLLLSFMLCLLCGGCTPDFKPMTGAPWKQKLMFEGPPGPPKFKKGWKDGCETAVAANTNSFQKFFHQFRQDGWMAQDPVYYSGWKTAWEYCMKYTFNYLHTEYIGGEW